MLGPDVAGGGNIEQTTATYLSVQEVADRLGVSVFTVRRYIRAGKLRAIKLDGVYRLSRQHLADFLREREIGGPVGAAEPSPQARRNTGAPASVPSQSSAANSDRL
jgi:excisionase family DNA binding protein